MYEKKKDTGRYIMLDRIIKYLFALIGAFTGVSLVRFFVKSVDFEEETINPDNSRSKNPNTRRC